jgi:hypothetical protein
MGFGYRHPSNCTRQELGHYAGAKVSPKERLMEFKVRGHDGLVPIGTVVGPTWFKVGQFVDTRSKNRGMGFAGVSFGNSLSPIDWWLTASTGYEKTRLQWSASKSRCVTYTQSYGFVWW